MLNVKEKHWSLVAMAAIIWLVLVLSSRLLFSAFTSGDDGYTAFAAVADKGIWGSAVEMAKFQGRFYQLLVYPVAMLPFTAESIVIANLFKIYTFLAFLAGMLVFLREMLGWRGALGCTAVFLCLFDTVGGSYNPFHGLPLWFGLGCGLLFFSLALHIRSLSKGTSSTFAYTLFALALLSYEIVILYAPLFILLTWHIRFGLGPVSTWGRSLLRALVASKLLIVYTLGYLVLYLLFRHFYPGTYSGADGLTLATPGAMAKPVIAFSIHSLHWGFSYSGDKALSIGSLIFGAVGVLAVVLGVWLDKPLGMASANPKIRITSWPVLALLTAYVFLPNLLFGFTERYRIWAGDGVQFYLGSLYSAVPLSILVYLAVRSIVRSIPDQLAGILVSGTLISFLLISTYANSKHAENFFAQSALMSNRWKIADWTVATTKFAERRARESRLATLCGEGFTHNQELPVYFRNPDMIADVEIYWSRYFTRELGRPVRYVSDADTTQTCDARLSLSYNANLARFEYLGHMWTRKVHF